MQYIMTKPYIIGISGESGVGKSTIAEIVALFFEEKNTTIISTDDLHKWERNNVMWETITHLNPDANNLELGDIHIKELSKGKSIFRSVYNHKTGNFNPPIKIEPQKIIIVEGLHSFYSDISKKTVDLKIFVDTDEELRIHWKIIRDTEERGYKYNMVLDAINKRKSDSDKIRAAQINVADVIVKMVPKQKIKCVGDKNEKVHLDLSISFKNEIVHQELFQFVKSYVTEFDKFVKASESVGENIELCQNGGGNISIKISEDFMMIKASGLNLKDVFKMNGCSLVNYKNIFDYLQNKKIKNDDQLNSILTNSVASSKYKKPSMETGFHVLLNKYVIHLHPIYLTLLLCLEDSKFIMNTLFSDLDYQYVDYFNPGYNLYKTINADFSKKVYFLENHGVIISSDDIESAMKVLYDIHNRSKDYVKQKCDFKEFDLSFANNEIEKHYIFPDFVIFSDDMTKKEILAAHNYITSFGNKLGKLRYLSLTNIHHLQKLESEKHRKTL